MYAYGRLHADLGRVYHHGLRRKVVHAFGALLYYTIGVILDYLSISSEIQVSFVLQEPDENPRRRGRSAGNGTEPESVCRQHGLH